MVTMPNPGMGPDSDSPANRTSRFRPQVSLAEELARAQSFTGANACALASLEEPELLWLGSVGEHPPKSGDRWALAGSFAALCLGRKTKPQKCDDVEADGRVDAAFRGVHAKSIAIAPVHDAGKVTGFLAVFSSNNRAFNGMHVAVLQTEADSLAELVQQARRAAGVKIEEKKEEKPEENQVRPVEVFAPQAVAEPAPAPVPPEPKLEAAAPPAEKSLEREFEALESAFIVVPPPVAGPPPAPAAEAAPPEPEARAAAPGAAPVVAPAPVPAVAAAPAPSAPGPVPERPTLPGFTPLSATAAALAKAKPMPPTSPDLVVETKVPKSSAPASVPTPPPMPREATPRPMASVPTPPPAPVAASPRPAMPASVPTPPPASPTAALPTPPAHAPAPKVPPPAVKFVPLAKPEVKTPPPGSLKPVTPASAKGSSAAGKAAETAEDQLMPAAADPFAEHAPVHFRSQPRPHPPAPAPSRPVLASLEEVGREKPSGAGTWRLPLVVAVLAAVGLGGLWLRTRSHAAQPKPAPVAVQPAPAPAATSEVAAAAPAPANPAAATAAPAAASAAPASAPASQPESVAEKPAPVKAIPQAKTQPETTAPKPAATVTASDDLAVKSPAPVMMPVTPRQQEPPPKTQLSLPAAASASLPDLPKPQAASVVRQASTPVPAQLLESVPPVYPSAAKALHLQSVVRLSAKVSAQGRVTDVTWISGNDFFKGSALSAIRQWRYKPASVDGQPVESTVEIVLKFKPQ